jgi:alpha-beta hydrolase superfamily lysophospholipase
MKNLEWNWKTADGLEMYSHAWLPDGQPEALLMLFHGLGEHIMRYQHVAQALVDRGFGLVGFDLRGHGRSGGPRGHAAKLGLLFDDIDGFFNQVDHQLPGIPKVLYGHSMGGFLILAYVPTRRPNVAKVIVTGSAIHSEIEKQKGKVLLTRILGSILPGVTISSGLETKALSRDDKVVEKYVADPLVHNKISTGLGKSFLDSIAIAMRTAPAFSVPVLLMHGTADRLAYPNGSEEWAALAPQKLVTLKLWEGLFHEIHNEPEKKQVLGFMLNWLEGKRQASEV